MEMFSLWLKTIEEDDDLFERLYSYAQPGEEHRRGGYQPPEEKRPRK